MSRFAFYCVLAAAASLAGCGDGKVPVSGTVSVEGTPVEEGTIRFIPVGEGAPEGAAIRQGKYEAELTQGEKIVEVQGSKKVGEAKHDPNDPSSPMVPVMESVVPRKYHRESPLKTTIDSENPDLNFDLDAK